MREVIKLHVHIINGKHEIAPGDQVSHLLVVYCSLFLHLNIYSQLPVTRILYDSNLPLTRSNFQFPSDHFPYNFTHDDSNSR